MIGMVLGMDVPVPARPLARLLPAGYPERLAEAAALHDCEAIDALTDELAQRHPDLVRPRGDAGRFLVAADVRRAC